MAISDTREETSTNSFSDHLTSDAWKYDANSSADVSKIMLHHCFENGSMLVPYSYFPPGPNGTYHIPPNITSMSDQNSSLLMDSEEGLHKEIVYLGDCFAQGFCYYINCSSWGGPRQLSIPIYGYIMPLIFVITLLSNILIILILSKRHMLSPTNLVLKAMAISDLLTVIFPFPWHFYIYTLGYDDSNFSGWEMGFIYEMMLETLPQIFHTASIWLTLALAMQRYIYVCHALAARSWCTMNRTRKAVALIYFFAFLHQATRFFDKKFESVTVEYPICSGEMIDICKVSFADWVIAISMNAYFITYFWFRALFVHMLPCLALVILNILLFRAMREADRKREKLLKTRCVSAATNHSGNSATVTNTVKPLGGESKETKKIRDTNNTTSMLVVVITVFLAVELPMGVVTTLHIISSSTTEFLDYSIVKTVILINNLFISMSYPLNFGIYCGMSKQFRDTFKQLIPIAEYCTRNNNNRNNGDVRAGKRSSGLGGHRRQKNCNNSNLNKQSEACNATRNKTSNAVAHSRTGVASSLPVREQSDKRKDSSLYTTQRDENGQNHPNVTTALLTDCQESGGYEMGILQAKENLKNDSAIKNGSSDKLSLINHNETKNSNDGFYKQTRKTNELHSQQNLLNVDLMSQSNAEPNLQIPSLDPWDDTNNKDQGNGKNIKLLTPLKVTMATSSTNAPSSAISNNSECKSNKKQCKENAFSNSFMPPATLTANSVINGKPNLASNTSSIDIRSNEEDITIITAQQVTHETHL